MKIVFVINSLTHYHIFFDYIKKLNEIKKYDIYSVLVKPELDSKVNNLKSFSNIIKIFESKETSQDNNKDAKIGHSKKKRFYFYFFYFFYLFWKHFKLLKKSRDIFNSIQPDFAFISSERYTTFDLFFAKTCNKNKVKVAVLGIDYFYVETFEGYLKSDKNRKIHTSSQKITSLFFPKQTFTVNNEKCLYYPPHLIWNLFFMNSLPSLPYLTGSRFVDQIHVDSEFTKKKYIDFGFNPKLIRVVGLLEHDLIYHSLNNKEKIRQDFNLDSNKKTVVFAVPQGFEHNLVSKEEHFEIINKLVDKILQYPVNLVLSLHPKMDLNNYLFLEEKYSLKISRISLREFIAIADLFVATYSSTVLWSAILNTPCLIFDMYELNYNSYGELQNVVRTKGFAEYEENLDKLIRNLDTKHEANRYNTNFGYLDNKVFERFLSNINEA